MIRLHIARLALSSVAMALATITPADVISQGSPSSRRTRGTPRPTPVIASKDSVVVRASDRYGAGSLKRYFLGDNYRDLWATPIKVPVLDLHAYAGGLRALKQGGGKQTKSLRLVASDGSEYVFRPIYKALLVLPDPYRGTIVWDIFRDAFSASHPTGPRFAAPVLQAADVLHPSPIVVVMPDDSLLGEWRKDYAGVLGMIEEYPDTPDDAPGFGGAVEIIDSEELLERINSDPAQQVDARALLTARLVDMLLNDNDRHADQWKWARLRPDATWLPISRDRDKVFISHEGLLPGFARRVKPNLVAFERTYPKVTALFENAVEFDRRLLGGLDKAAWDSVATGLVHTISDSVIDSALDAMPPEYAAASRSELSDKLRGRRDDIPKAATQYYTKLFRFADIHATDAADRASIVRSSNGVVDVQLSSGGQPPYFNRRFDARETKEIRLYLHGGDDSASVTGDARESIPLRIVGGNGNNMLVDAATVRGRRGHAYLYESGPTDGVRYEAEESNAKKAQPDSAVAGMEGAKTGAKPEPPSQSKEETKAAGDSGSTKVEGEDKQGEVEKRDKVQEDEPRLDFRRRPWVLAYGKLAPPQRDRGTGIVPIVGLKTGQGLGLVPRLGFARYTYAFRHVPYSSMIRVEGAYSTAIGGIELALKADKRFESSALQLLGEASYSQLNVGEFRGFGNNIPNLRGDFYDVRQSQYLLAPAIGLAFGPKSGISFGPVVKYTVTDSVPNRLLSEARPYGFGRFGQAGVQMNLRFDTHDDDEPGLAVRRGTVDVTGSVYPGVWDVEGAYEELSAVATTLITIPVLTRPVLAFRAGGKKLFGNFPYFDAAFLGGSESFRTERRQRFAGDASLFGTAELRVPVAQFPLFLPLDVGVLSFADVGRVYLDGESPGGWHKAAGAGFWLGVINPGTGINVLLTSNRERRVLVNVGFEF